MRYVCIRTNGYVAQDHDWVRVQYLNKLAQQTERGSIYVV